MSNKEFNEYIKSFNKNKGEYTNDEVFEIGVAHKSLLKEDRNWEALSKELGWNGSAESLRNFIKSRMRKEGTLPKNMREINNRTIMDLTQEELGEELVQKKQDLMVQQQKTRDEWTAYRRYVRDEARVESLKDCIVDTVSALNSLPKYTCKGTTNPNSEAILLFSDLHIGNECSNFYNTYNLEVAQQRVEKLVKDVVRYCKAHKINTLNFLNLGDLIHGIIHTNARIEQEMDVVNQVMYASEILANALNILTQACPNIIYRSVSDNHSRVSPNKEEAIENENMNKIIDWYVEERLKTTNIQFAKDNLDIGLGKFTLNNGKVVMFAHGHQDSKTNVVQNYVCATREFVDYICLGHFHSSSTRSFQGSRVFINGSIIGTEQYALSKRLFSEPSQKFIIIEDEGNILDIDISLK